MTYEERRTTVVRDRDPMPPARAGVPDRSAYVSDRIVDQHEVSVARPTRSTMAARVVALIFGLIQLVIGLRIVFLALNAREANALVAAILDLSRPLVDPFEGIFRTNALQAGGSVLDIAAIVALIGWTVIELVILAIMRIPRPGEDV